MVSDAQDNHPAEGAALGRAILDELGCVSFHFWEAAATPERVAEAHRRGVRVLLWTVNAVDRAQALLAMGVDGLFTDNLRVFAEALPALREP